MKKKIARIKRATKTRKKIRTLNISKLLIHRTSKHIYAQIISPDCSYVLASASTLEKKIMSILKNSGNKKAAEIIGKKIAERALNKNITKIAFDRSGFKYHGRVKALAEAARKFGLNF
ncbi:50S ribosomal subunit protein L18 [Wigglesworthia glossinidia endosymbiont of Glossina morsitans morsitans (Yale colony)]|uniref:Large ribosomal subunit protein uL18 n=1 Tax=Wigglesworthia glossinidia endosymbiont of Glossina morsitans morsitans (Yale colony) TaxID=1142511 RepID=H6Q4H7_WIGGL|nr:50S ribosomal protein L18 [Wigglesworthia glossinidia]AFA41037.1 50S ribosomal subunit protein L18 [Wigglesworthia glossinidia endosymbiont of Glossina morsitans morsitans (Yale colony)]